MNHIACQTQDTSVDTRAASLRPNTSRPQWVVDSDFEVLMTPAFDEKYSTYIVNGQRVPSPGLGAALRAGRAHFDTEVLARAHAVKLLDNSIEASEAQTELLRERRRELAEM